MVVEAQSNQEKHTAKEEMSSKSDVDGKAKSLDEQEPQEPIKLAVTDKKIVDGPNAAEMNEESKLPKNVVDEWPEPRKIHTFYFVRYRPYDDPKTKAKIEQADKEIQKKRQARSQVIDALKEKRSARAEVISQLKPLTTEDKNFRAIIDEKRKEMEPFQAALTKLRTVESARKSEGLCSSEEELGEVIRSLNFRLQHESNTIAQEKQILKEIKYLEGTREKVISNAAMTAKIGDSLGQKEDMRGQVKQIGVNLDAVRKDQQAVRAKIKGLENKLLLINEEIASLGNELNVLDQKTNSAFDSMRELRKARDEVNVCFQQNRVLLNSVRELAAKKDVESLEKLYHSEVEAFMSQWNSQKTFRDDYSRRILTSLDARQLSRDGRMRNPDEKPIVVVEAPKPVDIEVPKAGNKKAKEDSIQATHQDSINRKAPKEDAKKSRDIEIKEKEAALDTEKTSLSNNSNKGSPEGNELDAMKIKEMKKAEEIAKAKQAQERKKKLADKAANKAAARMLKEAEKKVKEKEKKARKKAGQSAEPEIVEEAEETPVEEPKEPQAVREAPTKSKSTRSKEGMRFRPRPRGSNQPPKIILNRKKSQSYWIWAASTAAILLVLALGGFYYSSLKN